MVTIETSWVSNAHGRLGNARKPDHQVTRMVVVMIVAFMVGWAPYAVFSITVTACPTIHLDPRLAAIPAFFSKTAAVYNPVIYVFMNKQGNWLDCRGHAYSPTPFSGILCFKKCLIQLFSCNSSAALDSNVNQTSERPGATGESNTGDMLTIAAQIPVAACAAQNQDEETSEGSTFSQLPLSENKVCPM
ncbi:hypothetical protein SKAU_G00163800 [Synaphobranchus kaupii]|uniref:G-protein coupled receptors family 1 profile domain-containing protein n=1 Tax=Synaphobranchus kaupii TaxID=118154 RepID=A0A9Q1FJL5_SYNKA|nr:hypothetical protein SKAU_G00163800 [Synaphobranchus kaupii]